jgi:hypothetical protein
MSFVPISSLITALIMVIPASKLETSRTRESNDTCTSRRNDEAYVFKVVDVQSFNTVIITQRLQDHLDLKEGGVQVKCWLQAKHTASALPQRRVVVQDLLNELSEIWPLGTNLQ